MTKRKQRKENEEELVDEYDLEEEEKRERERIGR